MTARFELMRREVGPKRIEFCPRPIGELPPPCPTLRVENDFDFDFMFA